MPKKSTLTKAQLAAVTPDVITLLDGNSKVGNAKIICYPALKFPGRPGLLYITMTGDAEPKPAKNFKQALAQAAKVAKDMKKKWAPKKPVKKTRAVKVG